MATMTWTTVLTDPPAFFAERGDDPELRGPALVVLVVGLLGLLSAVPTLLLVLRGVPPGARGIVGIGLAIVRRIAGAHGWTVGLAEGHEGGLRIEFDDVASD